MATRLWQLTVCDEFAAAHALRHYKGKCERLHGHNFSVELTVEGRRLTPETELLMDFTTLKAILANVLRDLDHTTLNDVPPFDTINPSSENLAHHIWQGVVARLVAHADPQAALVRPVSVSVSEKYSQRAVYREIDEP
ncbi:MAG: 6-pyruvoyltetrahydropterin/6-carboxytetrahydropterin synthase [Candidatus Desulfovibrio kirbyi]|uniref:6-carboxy-5,6,7,8-tetrahydropterin synthase n=1 Tax=Candidatus Desulfovibrio kirbyi TaxID=2696086 RepID=A0A6L2R4U0_9BACT|nr:MAG: 6-pyruvoyltetrahydropterin/6-carboxytetrahydropterin synthase [Candidatus Desulfovibrio kirbyi]